MQYADIHIKVTLDNMMRLKFTLILGLLSQTFLSAQYKANELSADKENTTTIEETSPALKSSKKMGMLSGDMFKIDYQISEAMTKLIQARSQLIDNLATADEKINKLIIRSRKWDSERNKNKKGQFDTIIDNAERLAVSNELRIKISDQAIVISSYIRQIQVNREHIEKQKKEDEQQTRMDASMALIKKLEYYKIKLERDIKALAIAKETGNEPSKKETKKALKVAKYLKISTKITLREVSFNELNDEEKWILIYQHSENRAFLKEKSPTAIVPLGVELAIPEIEEK
jgi:hypothetical protein